jgi:FkbM family methyltransferase
MFNNCDPEYNGEIKFYNDIKDQIHVIFDVGCRSESVFTRFTGVVHYFDPVSEYVEELKLKPNDNKYNFFNSIGLGNVKHTTFYYPRYESFYNRTTSCGICDDANKKLLHISTGKEYIQENNIQCIDFLKIDTEGYELQVLQGFDDFLENIKVIQFEYGGTFLDNHVKLVNVIHYLEKKGFYRFSYLSNEGLVPIRDFTDHYQYCNIVCFHKNFIMKGT